MSWIIVRRTNKSILGIPENRIFEMTEDAGIVTVSIRDTPLKMFVKGHVESIATNFALGKNSNVIEVKSELS